jgi:cbb3-type cytochrome oxidase maturation protein
LTLSVDILFLLVPLSVVLVFALMGVFAWALHTSQFDDLTQEGARIIADEPGLDADQSPP